MVDSIPWRVSLLVLASGMLLTAGDWRYWGGDAGGTKYSSLSQITKKNVKSLRVAWTFDVGDMSDGANHPTRSTFEATPLVVDGVLYVSTPFCRVFALNAETGAQVWVFDPEIDRSTRTNLFVNRGVSYWTDGERKRILLGDLAGRLWALDAATGRPVESFGSKGVIDLKAGMTDGFDKLQYRVTSPPAVCGDAVITGALVTDSQPQGPSGDLRAFDARNGKPLWRFHTVPLEGELGHDTWKDESWRNRGGTNVWSIMSVDEKTSTVFAPLTSPSYDFYGGDRKGANLFGNSVVALDCATGKRKWHFQTIHHDIWDYDLPSQPVLAEVRRGGQAAPAVAQITKTGFVFLLDRRSGTPLFPVVERPVPRSMLPGEESWPTQPFPMKPPPFARQSMSAADVTTVLPESRRECLELLEGAKVEVKLFDPWTEENQVIFPGLNGGANWGGAAFDPARGLLFVNSMDVGGLFRLVKRPEGASIPYALRSRKYEFFWDKNRYPCQQPPWGSLTAIDLNSGEFRWRVRLGEFDELKEKGIPKTGAPNLGGPIVTAGGLVFIAATNDRRFRAFDKDTGEELWVASLPASGFATPATYTGPKSRKQYVVIAAGGGNKYDSKFDSKLIAFALP